MALIKKQEKAPENLAPEAQITERLNSPSINPEIDKKINAFMAANPDLVNYLSELPKERLVRRLCLDAMNKETAKQNLNRGFQALAESNPALAQAIEAIRKTVPKERQEASITALGKAFAIATDQRVKPIKAAPTQTSGSTIKV